MAFIRFIGSVLLGAIFLGSGFGKVTDPAQTAGFIKTTKFYDIAVKNGVPLNEGDNLTTFTIALGALMILGAVMFILNVGRPLAALMLAGFVAAFTAFVHVNLDDPSATSTDNVIHTMKNVAIIGGLLMGACSGRSCGSSSSAKKVKKD